MWLLSYLLKNKKKLDNKNLIKKYKNFKYSLMQNFIQFRLSQASVSVDDVWGAVWVGIVSEIWKT